MRVCGTLKITCSACFVGNEIVQTSNKYQRNVCKCGSAWGRPKYNLAIFMLCLNGYLIECAVDSVPRMNSAFFGFFNDFSLCDQSGVRNSFCLFFVV